MKGTLGDCWDRYWVKMQEMKQCVRILRQCIEQMPDGPFRAKLPRAMKVPPGEVYAEYENPRGHLGFYHRKPGRADPVPREDPRAIVRQSRRHGGTVPQRAAGGCAGDRRIDRHRDGRSGSVAMANREAEVIIAGFGLPGRVAAELLASRDIPFCVIELNAETVHRCVRVGTPIIVGDCADPEVLIRAGIKKAKTFIAVVPNEHAGLTATVEARRLNPSIRIITRCHYTSAGIEAKARGADEVVVAEQVVAAEIRKLLADHPE